MVAAAAWLGRRGSTNHAPWASICHTTSMPPSTRPKTTCLPSSHGVSWVVMKNCEPLVSGPALAIESVPAPPCLIAKLSSANLVRVRVRLRLRLRVRVRVRDRVRIRVRVRVRVRVWVFC